MRTQRENAWSRKGESHPKAKLTNHEVDLILALHHDGMEYALIAEKFEISVSSVGKIVRGLRRCT